MVTLQIIKWSFRLQWTEVFISKEIVLETFLQKYGFCNRQPSSVALSLGHFFHFLTCCMLVIVQRAAKDRSVFQSNVWNISFFQLRSWGRSGCVMTKTIFVSSIIKNKWSLWCWKDIRNQKKRDIFLLSFFLLRSRRSGIKPFKVSKIFFCSHAFYPWTCSNTVIFEIQINSQLSKYQ